MKTFLIFAFVIVAAQIIFAGKSQAAVFGANGQQLYQNVPPTYGYCDPGAPDFSPSIANWGVATRIEVNKYNAGGVYAGKSRNFKVRIRSFVRDDINTKYPGYPGGQYIPSYPDGSNVNDLREIPGQPIRAIAVGTDINNVSPHVTSDNLYDTVDVTLNNSNAGICNSYNIDSGLVYYNLPPGAGYQDSIKRGMDKIALDCIQGFGGPFSAAKFTFELLEVDGVEIPENERVTISLQEDHLNNNLQEISFSYGVEGSFNQCEAIQLQSGSRVISPGESVTVRGIATGPPLPTTFPAVSMQFHRINRSTWDGKYSATTRVGGEALFADMGSNGQRQLNETIGFPSPGQYEIHLIITEGGYINLWQNSGEGACAMRIDVAERPYFKVYGNDVRAGGQFENAVVACGTELEKANILTFSRNIGGSGNAQRWVGASTQYAVSATGDIDNFFSAGRRNGLAQPKPPTDLTFGNYNGSTRFDSFSPAPGTSGMGRCIPDYYEIARSNNKSNDGNIVTGRGVANYNDFTHISNGDIHISGNLYFNSTSWQTVDRIPSIVVIVKGGDIYIDSEVSRLDGLYIAQPDENGKGGRIFTCSTGIEQIPPRSGAGGIRSLCGGKLTVNGAFIARQVRFLRSGGDVSKITNVDEPADSTNIAEVFNFSPETYLSTPRYLQRGSTTGRYDSILSLPPVL